MLPKFNDDGLKLVLIYSWGQARDLQICEDGRVIGEMKLEHNSIVGMTGSQFHARYQCRIKPQPPQIKPDHYWALICRYKN
jgi:hypothetical protein